MQECTHDAWLSGLLDGELTEDQQRQLRQHLQGCARCRELLGDLETVERCLGAVPGPCPVVWEALWRTVAQRLACGAEVRPDTRRVPAAGGRAGATAALLSHLSGVRRWFLESRPRWALAVAAGILALLVGLLVLSSLLPGAKPGWPGPSGLGERPVALAPAEALDVEIEQSEGGPGALLLVSADGEVAVVWVTGDQPSQAAPGS